MNAHLANSYEAADAHLEMPPKASKEEIEARAKELNSVKNMNLVN